TFASSCASTAGPGAEMPHALCLQPWTTISGNASTVVQGDTDWADLAGYESVAIYTEVSSITNGAVTTTLNVDSSPTRDERFFLPMRTSPFGASPQLGVQNILVLGWRDLGGFVLARYLRWSVLFGAAPTAITFRIWLTLLQAGW